jgi:hypothetical protein
MASSPKLEFAIMYPAPMRTSRMGPVERKHLHIVEVGLSLLAHASIPLKFWDDAFLAVVYLINRTPSKILEYKTPLEHLFHQKPDYTSLHVFGCAYWPNLHPYNTPTLEFRSRRCVFLGYSILHKGFKCLNPSSGHVYISCDVTFDGTIFPFSELNPNAGQCLREEISLLMNGELQTNDHVTRCSTNPATNHYLPGEDLAVLQEEITSNNKHQVLNT